MTAPSSSVRRARRAGFTLAEMLIVLVLLGLVGGTIVRVLARQQRFFRGTADIVEVRTQLRQAAAILYGDLRGISTSGGDLLAMTDSSLDFRYTIGSSVVCVIPTSGGTTLVLPPSTLASGNVLTSWISPPGQTGDTAYVYDDGANSTASSDDQWRGYGVSAVTATVGGCPATTGFTGAADATSSSYTLTLASNLSSTIVVGAPVRFVRRAHYSLYQSTSDRQWYLGYCSPACSATNPIQAIAGPFLPYVATTGTGTSGIRITYTDTTGATTATPASVGQISLVLRGQTASTINVPGLAKQAYLDSMRVVVTVRNPR